MDDETDEEMVLSIVGTAVDDLIGPLLKSLPGDVPSVTAFTAALFDFISIDVQHVRSPTKP